ncbi:MAG TPA: hypothetical protein VHB49_00985 [Bradyrhizobium sp.]|nr:hypothetical protein [Bradyrhizobium sp.]
MVGFPLLLIPVALYNIIVFLMPSVSFGDTLVKVPLISGADWPVNLTDVLLALGILLLLLEVIKGARPGAKYLMDHLLSLIIFGGAAAEFLMWPRFGTSTYFLLTLLALADFLSGTALHVRRGRRVVMAPVAAPGSVATAGPQYAPPPPAPAAPPESPTPAAAPVVEPMPVDRLEPKEAQPDSGAASPEVASPELQPGHASPSPEEPKH